jgi:hypothetical protein
LCLWKIYYLLVQLMSIRQRKLHPQSGFFEFGKLPLNEGSWQETKHFAKMLYLLGFQIIILIWFYCFIVLFAIKINIDFLWIDILYTCLSERMVWYVFCKQYRLLSVSMWLCDHKVNDWTEVVN